MGEFGYREVPTVNMFFRANLMPFPFHRDRIYSPKKLTPEERLRRYVELKYGKMSDNKKKNKNVEKKS